MSLLPLLAMLLCLQVAITDLYARRVSNRWLLAATAAGLAMALTRWATGDGFPGAALLGLCLGLAVLLPFYAIGWMGAGDVKFFAVLGLLLGWQALLPIWVAGSLLAGVHAVIVLNARALAALMPPRMVMLREQAVSQWRERPLARDLRRARQGRKGIPYAAYLGIGAIGWVLWTSQGAQP